MFEIKNIYSNTYFLSISSFSSNGPGKSLLLPKTKPGIPCNCGLSKRLCCSFHDASTLS